MATPQSQPADARQVLNNAGGFVYEITPEQRLQRWLIMGASKCANKQASEGKESSGEGRPEVQAERWGSGTAWGQWGVRRPANFWHEGRVHSDCPLITVQPTAVHIPLSSYETMT
jgi:hypothetical protein